MKKYISLFLCLTCILTLVARWEKKPAPFSCPNKRHITHVDVTRWGKTPQIIQGQLGYGGIISDISSSEPTVSKVSQDFSPD